MSDHSSDDQRQCRRGAARRRDVELDAAMALADMAGAGPAAPPPPPPPVHHPAAQAAAAAEQEEELASTRLSLELGKVGIQSSSCSSSSSAGHHPLHAATAAAAPGYGPRPRHMVTEAEKEAKRLRRVLANRESARQTILRRQAIRDELARKVADLSSQNEAMKMEKGVVMQEYLSLKETNKKLKEQVAKTVRKDPAPAAADMETSPAAEQQAGGVEPMAAAPPQAGFLYSAAPPVPYVWGSWPPPPAGYEHGGAPAPLCMPPPPPPHCAWYYPVVAADPRGSPPSYPQPFQDPPPRAASGGGGSPADEEEEDDDPCSLTLAIDVDRQKGAAPSNAQSSGGGGGEPQGTASDREKAATAAEARKRRKELTKLKQMHGGGRPGGEQW